MKKQLIAGLIIFQTLACYAQKFPEPAMTPPMGLNSWNIFQTNLFERLVKDIAAIIASSGMRDAAYIYMMPEAYLVTGERNYLDGALANLDYLLGRNGTGYSYVTSYGYKTPMHPHHRISAADGVVDPVPGLLVGGPDPGQQDGVKLPGIIPDEAYTDDERAYAVNGIAINRNAPFAYLANALQALRFKAGLTKK
ncbi:MAG TPA: glycoside hydrolase family 9 protein [Mucilaginibacter sp.]|nr:glycoside hydrolase family 9 protein [Mucilaginibacter sp.]